MQLLIVVVRYKLPFAGSETMRSLTQIFQANPGLHPSAGILLWDNSPDPIDIPIEATIPLRYHFSGENQGVSGAYNGAMGEAEALGCPWMLLFDQDSTVPLGYVERMLEYSHQLESHREIATVVPFVWSHDTLVSPRVFGPCGRNRQILRQESGILNLDAFGVNSGTLIRVSALREVGGYSPVFWLDFSDQYLFHTLFLHGKRIFLAGDLELAHSIASLDYDSGMSTARYGNFLEAEAAFFEHFHPGPQNWGNIVILLLRTLRQLRRHRRKDFARLTFLMFLRRCFRGQSKLAPGRIRRPTGIPEARHRDMPLLSDQAEHPSRSRHQ